MTLASSQVVVSLLSFCLANCLDIVAFWFHNILTRHLVHKNGIELIAYYALISQTHLKTENILDGKLVLRWKTTQIYPLIFPCKNNLTSTLDEQIRLGPLQISSPEPTIVCYSYNIMSGQCFVSDGPFYTRNTNTCMYMYTAYKIVWLCIICVLYVPS